MSARGTFRIQQCVMQALEARRLLAVVAVSVNSVNSATGNAATDDPPTSGAITDDGRFTVFVSGASNLVAGTDSTDQIVRRDIVNNSSALVSLASDGTSVGDGASSEAWISGDGRFVAFNSKSSNLVAADNDSDEDVFIRDMDSGVTQLVTVGLDGTSKGGLIQSISRDGRFVLFKSVAPASQFVSGVSDSNDAFDLFLRDMLLGETRCVSVNFSGNATGNGISEAAESLTRGQISDDGRFVLFKSSATTLIEGFVNNNGDQPDLYVRDLATSTIDLVTSTPSSAVAGGNGASTFAVMNPSGQYIAFVSSSTNLVSGMTDQNGLDDVFHRDRLTATTTLISKISEGTATTAAASGEPSISADGIWIAFTSGGALLPLDQNNNLSDNRDIYFTAVPDNFLRLMSVNATETSQGNGGSFAPTLSARGHFVAFNSAATNLAAGDTLGDANIDTFVRSTGFRDVTTQWASVHTTATTTAGSVGAPLISTDGSRVLFASDVPTIFADGDGTLDTDLFAAEVTGGEFARVVGHLLLVDGTLSRDVISFSGASGALSVTRNGHTLNFSALLNESEIRGEAGDDHISGSVLHDIIFAGAGNDVVWGNDGYDKILGGDGDDTLSGGAQGDTIHGDNGKDRLNGNGGNDRLFGFADVDRLYGYNGNDLLDGGSSSDRLEGNAGIDILYGQGGNDRFFAADGEIDQLFGGAGTDRALRDDNDLIASIEVRVT